MVGITIFNPDTGEPMVSMMAENVPELLRLHDGFQRHTSMLSAMEAMMGKFGGNVKEREGVDSE